MVSYVLHVWFLYLKILNQGVIFVLALDNLLHSGFTSVKELTLDVQNVIAPPREKFKSVTNEKDSTIDSPTAASLLNADVKPEKSPITDEQTVENESAHNISEDGSAKSAPNSPARSAAIASPPREFPDFNFDKAMDPDASPRDKDYQRYSFKYFYGI